MDTLDMFDDVDRLRDLRIGIEKVMFKYFDKYSSLPNVHEKSVASQTKLRSKSHPLEAFTETPSNKSQTTAKPVTSPTKHDFVVRVTDISSVYLSKDVEATRAMCVLMDNHTVVNRTSVMAVLQRVANSEISTEISAEYYTGELYSPPKPSKVEVHLPLIIGVSIGKYVSFNTRGGGAV
jgi:hypothetical protein